MTTRVRLVFPDALVREPVVARLARDFAVEANIRRAAVEEHSGWIVCELGGEPGAVSAALDWLHETGVSVEPLGDVVES
ncbi:MAG: NIL domain-containing protein [Actinomycetota bacterium]|nr:NIL domain-containing protein [Actinomycetota bacterium]